MDEQAAHDAGPSLRDRIGTLLELGRDEEAERLARARLAVDPADPQALGGLARALIGLRRYDEAVPLAEAAAATEPGAYAAWLLATSYHFVDRDVDAVRVARDALLDAPDDSSLLHALARSLRPTDPLESLRVALTALEGDPDDPDLHVAAGAAYLALDGAVETHPGQWVSDEERSGRCEWHLRRALEIEPDSATAIDHLARLHLYEHGSPAQALRTYVHGGQLHPLEPALPWNATVLPAFFAFLALLLPALGAGLLMLLAWPVRIVADPGVVTRVVSGAGALALVASAGWYVRFVRLGAGGLVGTILRRSVALAPLTPVVWVLHVVGAVLLAWAALRADMMLASGTLGVLVVVGLGVAVPTYAAVRAKA